MKQNTVLILACAPISEGGGIYRYTLTESGEPVFDRRLEADFPMYAVVSDEKLYVALRAPFVGSKMSGVACAPSDLSAPLSNPISVQGAVAAHLAVEGDDIYTANYTSGNVTWLCGGDVKIVGHTGGGPNLKRQEQPHPHHVCLTPDKKFVCVTDLGTDSIYVYDRELNPVSRTLLHPGCGPRHTLFTADGRRAYCVTELGCTLETLSFSNGVFTWLASADLLPEGYGERDASTGAAVRESADERFVYVSTRYHDSIAVFRTDNGGLPERVEIVSCGGSWPRDINLTSDGRFLICANERENTVTFFSRGTDGRLARLPEILKLNTPLNILCM